MDAPRPPRRFWLAPLLAALLAVTAAANDASRTDLTLDLIASATNLTAGASTSVEGIDFGQSEIQGLDWDAQSAATFTLTYAVTYSNSPTGPFSSWTSIHSTSHTTSWTTASGTLSSGTYYLRGGTDLRLYPCRYGKVTITNNGAGTVTLNRVTMFTY